MMVRRVKQPPAPPPPERFPNQYNVVARENQVFILHPRAGQPLSRDEAINLCAWVGVIADLKDEELAEARAAILSGPEAPTSQAG